jgi:crotonobetainyl-CoA:carnitine CoA-transferase CaiB-like acyl-CoA transferase
MTTTPQPLAGIRILSLALNLPGPAALMRCRALGADCLKFEPPAGDPMSHYSAQAYEELHAGVTVRKVDLKTLEGQAALQVALAQTDVLITSFRPSALAKLGLSWDALNQAHPHLSQVAIVGAGGASAEIPGHDLTYQAEHGLVSGLHLPPTLFADMGGALMATEAVLQAVVARRNEGSMAATAAQEEARAPTGKTQPGQYFEVALANAAALLALPRRWGLTRPQDIIGGAHAGYQVYACRDGRIAVAALEPHFARRLMEAADLRADLDPISPEARQSLNAFFAAHSTDELDAIAASRDIPMHSLAA